MGNKITIIIDTREQNPLHFDDLHIAGVKSLPSERGTLHTGDYAIKGLETVACWERKAMGDLYGTVVGDHTFVAQWEKNAEPAKPEPAKPAKKLLPKTGDMALPPAALGFMGALGTGLIGVGLKRRKREEDENEA